MPRPAPDETWTSEALLAHAVEEATRSDEDDDGYWAAVAWLRKKGVEQVWSLVAPLVGSPVPQVRALIPDTLRYFAPHPLREETVALLATMLETETSPLVLESLAGAFVDLRHPRAEELLPALLDHPDPRVRGAAIHGLLSVAGPATVGHFVRASTDDDADVRNWSTFGLRMLLGDMGDADVIDTEEVRNALLARLGDEDEEIRAEAILALATRRDLRALPTLQSELRDWPQWDHCIEAARYFGAPELYPLLTRLLHRYPEEESTLRSAIDACRPRFQA
jgi:HEAT repeat protein